MVAAATAEKFIVFLLKYDTVAAGRGKEWTAEISLALAKADYFEPDDLIGATKDAIIDSLPSVKGAVVYRAIDKLTQTIKGNNGPPSGVSTDKALQEIAKAIWKNEPEKVALDVGPKLGSLAFQGLHCDLWPRASAVNFLATEGQKQRIG